MISEFDIIANFFRDQARDRGDVIKGIGDDAAILTVSNDKDLLLTVDTLVSGRHFFPETDPFDIGYKALAVSLSDIAAMAGRPAWASMALTLPEADQAWLAGFSEGFFSAANQYNVSLVGGDITRGPLTITVQLHGLVNKGKAVRRCGARVGDSIFVTGCLGDAGLALAGLLGEISLDAMNKDYFLQRLLRPKPRISEIQMISSYINSAVDISDGLAADLGHVLKASGVGATVQFNDIPLSDQFGKCVDTVLTLSNHKKKVSRAFWDALILSGGDDYEICFTVSPEWVSQIQKLSAKHNISISKIGYIEDQPGLRVQGHLSECLPASTPGYQHF